MANTIFLDQPRCQLYRLTFPNGKSYIGITTQSLARRLTHHRSQARRPGRDFPLQQAMRKYGDRAFVSEVLIMGSVDFICEMERAAIRAFGTLAPDGYNVDQGGLIPMVGRKVSDASRAAASARGKARAGQNNGLPGTLGNKATLGFIQTPAAREKISLAQKNHRPYRIGPHTEVTKEKMSVAQMGHEVPDAVRLKISKAQQGRAFTAEHRAKLSVAARNRTRRQ